MANFNIFGALRLAIVLEYAAWASGFHGQDLLDQVFGKFSYGYTQGELADLLAEIYQ